MSVQRALATALTGAMVAAAAVIGLATPAAAAAGNRTLTAVATEVPDTRVDVQVSGTGYEDVKALPGQASPHLYAALIVAGSDLASIDMGGAVPNISAAIAPDGSIAGTLTQDAATLDRTQTYEVITWPSRTLPSAANLYSRADVSIDWDALFPKPAVATQTSLVASASSIIEGSSVTFTATVSPVAAGTVTLSDGQSVAASNGVAVFTVSPAAGTHSFTASFAPEDGAAYLASDSEAVSLSVTAKPVTPVYEPKLSVFLADGTTPYTGQPLYDGDALVVRGSGFDPQGNVGGRGAPLPVGPQGTYVVLGSFLADWKPSASAPSSARKIADQRWAMSQAVLDSVPAQYKSAVAGQAAIVSSTGEFTLTLTAQKFDTALAGGAWGVYSYAAGGVVNASQELSVAVDYRGAKAPEPTPTPTPTSTPTPTPTVTSTPTPTPTATPTQPAAKPRVTVTPSSDLDPSVENTVTVSGTGFTGAGAANGVYLALGEASNWTSGAFPADGWISLGWVMPGQLKNGAFTTTLTVPAGALRPGTSYIVGTSAAHGLSVTDRSLDTRTAVSVKSGSTPEPTPTPTTPTPTPTPTTPTDGPHVTLSPSAELDPAVENVITVSGTGFTGAGAANGVYLGLGEASNWTSGAFPADGWLALAWVMPGQVKNGAFTTTLTVPAGALQSGKSYIVGTSAAHGLSVTDRTLDTRTAVSVKSGSTPEPTPTPTPTPTAPSTNGPELSVSPTGALDPNVENVITVTGTGYIGSAAVNGVYIGLGESALWQGKSAFPQDGWLDVQWITPQQLSGGSFTATFTVPAGTFDPKVSYQFATSAAHGLSITNRSLDAFAAVEIQDVALEPAIRVGAAVVKPGGELTVTGVGFPAGAPVTVTIHSEPFVLGTAPADETGAFSVTGTLPADFPAGEHTVIATSGDIEKRSTITVAAAVQPTPAPGTTTPAAPVCTAQEITGGSFEWGVKASFVNYINGPIAKGSSSIGWGSASGAYNAADARGRVSYAGAASFTGHSGLLDLTLSNPRVVLTGASSATLYVDVVSAGYGGKAAVNQSGVAFATLNLSAASSSGLSWSGAPATLTAAGAAAFMGFYNAGDALDPVSFSFSLGAEVPCDSSTDASLAVTGSEAPAALLWAALGLIALGAGVVVRRRLVAAAV